MKNRAKVSTNISIIYNIQRPVWLSLTRKSCLLFLISYSLFFKVSHSSIMTHGPVVGGVTHTEAVLWLRTDEIANILFRYSTNPDLYEANVSDNALTDSIGDFTASVSVINLLPDSIYYYTPNVDGVDSFTDNFPSFRTAPTPGDPTEFKVVVLTDFIAPDTLYEKEFAETFTTVGQESAAFTLVGGDFDHSNPGKDETDLEIIRNNTREMHKNNYNRNLVRRTDFVDHVLRRGSIIHAWDDHDFCCNDANGFYVGKGVALQAFDEYFPSYSRPFPDDGIFHSWTWGQVEFFQLDVRYNRFPSREPDNEQKTMLGSIQKEWLKQALKSSSALWKIILTESPFNPTVKCGADNWCDYQTEGKELVDYIKGEGIKNIIFISGDIHAGAITNGMNSLYDTFWEMAVPNADLQAGFCDSTLFRGIGRFGEWTHGTWGEGFGALIPPQPCRGYGVIEVFTDPDQVQLSVKDEHGVTKLVVLVPDESGNINQLPNAVIVASPISGDTPLVVSFSGSMSTDSDGSIASFTWDFGDGQVDSTADVEHIYSVAGQYIAKLTVTDDGGASASDSITITVTDPAGVTYEMEDGQISGNALIASISTGFTGSGYIHYFKSGGTVEHTVNAPLAGLYELAFRYSLLKQADSQIVVNGLLVDPSLVFTATAQSEWNIVSTTVELDAGENSVSLSFSNSQINVDSMIVTSN